MPAPAQLCAFVDAAERARVQGCIEAALTVDPVRLADRDVIAVRERVTEAIRLLDEQICSIKAQLDGGLQATPWASDHYGDRAWWNRIQTAKRHKCRQRNQLQAVVGELSRRVRAQNKEKDEKCFIQVASRMLPPETFSAIFHAFLEQKRRLEN
jgi:hypothetical protein